MNSVAPAYILCGGQSRRFGSDKARVLVAHDATSTSSIPLLIHLKSQLEQHGHDVYCVADHRDRYLDLNLTCLVDRQADSGPLSGLASALAHRASTGGGWLLLVNCDQWRWSEEWYHELDALRVQARDQELLAVAYHDEVWQPFAALYHSNGFATVQQQLSQGKLSLHAVLDRWLDEGRCLKVERVRAPERWSFNTPGELNQLKNDAP